MAKTPAKPTPSSRRHPKAAYQSRRTTAVKLQTRLPSPTLHRRNCPSARVTNPPAPPCDDVAPPAGLHSIAVAADFRPPNSASGSPREASGNPLSPPMTCSWRGSSLGSGAGNLNRLTCGVMIACEHNLRYSLGSREKAVELGVRTDHSSTRTYPRHAMRRPCWRVGRWHAVPQTATRVPVTANLTLTTPSDCTTQCCRGVNVTMKYHFTESMVRLKVVFDAST